MSCMVLSIRDSHMQKLKKDRKIPGNYDIIFFLKLIPGTINKFFEDYMKASPRRNVILHKLIPTL